MQDKRFKTYVRMHQDIYQEFTRGWNRVHHSFTVLKLLALVYLLVGLFYLRVLREPYILYVLALVTAVVYAVKFWRSRGGSVQYRQMLAQNRDKPVYYTAEMDESGIHVVNTDNDNRSEYRLEQIIRILETEHLLILEMKPQLGFLVDKTTLTGGSREEFITFLQTHCPNLKRKRVKKARKWSLLTIVYLTLLLLHLPMAIGTHSQSPSWFPEENPVSKGMSFSECASVLRELGFEIEADVPARLDADFADLPEEAIGFDKMTILLSEVGMGEYDFDTWEWTPATGPVYAFDMEVFDIERMYTDFLRGVSAISGGELVFTNVEEDFSRVDLEEGSGTRVVSFDWNGQRHTLEANEMHDWFDPGFADKLAELLAQAGGEKQLFYATDGYQMCFVFYCTPQWAAEFSRHTGVALFSDF